MPQLDRSQIRAGMFMAGATYPASQKAGPGRGDFLIAGHYPVILAKGVEEKSGTLAAKPGLYALPDSEAALAIRLDAIRGRLKDLAALPVPPGVGLSVRRDLERLTRDRGLKPDGRPPLPLAASCAGPQLVRGIASRVAIDSVNTMVMPEALYWDPDQLPPLRFRHGEVCGQILSLSYSFLGDELEIEARVDCLEAARMPAFSVAITPCSYETVDRGDKAPHIRISRARLDEVSMTDRPALASALVTRRCPAAALLPADARYRALAAQVDRLRLVLAA